MMGLNHCPCIVGLFMSDSIQKSDLNLHLGVNLSSLALYDGVKSLSLYGGVIHMSDSIPKSDLKLH